MHNSLEILIAPVITLFSVQTIKLTTDGIKGNFNLKSILMTYGGMPSAHSAVVASLTAMVGYIEGLNSTTFAIAATFSMIVIVDAMVFRRYVDRHGLAIEELAKRLPAAEQKQFSGMPIRLEHTFPQVLVGVIIGILIATIVQAFI